MTVLKNSAVLLLLLGVGVRADVSPKTGPVFRPARARLLREFDLKRSISIRSQGALSGNASVCVAENGTDLRFFSTLTGKEISVARTGAGIHDGAFSHDGTRYASANEDGKVRLWDTGTGEKLNEFDVGGQFS